MAVSVSILAVVTSLHLLVFAFAFGAERRRSTAVAVPDKYDEQTFCMYGTEAATVYGMSASGLLLVSQKVVNGVTKCLCCGKGLVTGTSSTAWAIVFFVVSCLHIVTASRDGATKKVISYAKFVVRYSLFKTTSLVQNNLIKGVQVGSHGLHVFIKGVQVVNFLVSQVV